MEDFTKYNIDEDVELILGQLECTEAELAKMSGISVPTINRWRNGKTDPAEQSLERLYEFAYRNNLMLSKVKCLIQKDECSNRNTKLLFHGSRNGLKGNLCIDRSKENSDFGKGFYCGDNFNQACTFVAWHKGSSTYLLEFKPIASLKVAEYKVDFEWVVTIAYFRGRLGEYAADEKIQKIIKKANDADYIIAPIADNRMYETIDSFIDGVITDRQCQHCLSSTHLGMQYVFRKKKALKRLEVVDRIYLSDSERKYFKDLRNEEQNAEDMKTRFAIREYRNEGRFIDQIFKSSHPQELAN